MFGISEFFKKFQSGYAREVLMRQVIQSAIKKNTHIEIPITAIGFRSGVVILENISQSLRSAIYIKKQAILRDIADRDQQRRVTDIR